MGKRPALNDSTFLSFVFHPSKSAKPTGLRKTTLKGTKGRKKARLASYNRMDAVKQAILAKTGSRDAYLRGDITLIQARGKLREQAVALGVAKPVRQRNRPIIADRFQSSLDKLIQQHLKTTVVAAGRPFNQRTSDREIYYIEPSEDMLGWSYSKIKYAGRKGSEYEVVESGTTHNPFWYH